jgi:hypothetical protein
MEDDDDDDNDDVPTVNQINAWHNQELHIQRVALFYTLMDFHFPRLMDKYPLSWR